MSTQRQVNNALLRLRDAYPNLFTESQEQWEGRIKAYHAKLRKYDPDVIDEACSRAPEKYPDRFPTAGQLWGLCKGILEDWHTKAKEAAEEAARKKDDEETAASVAYLRRNVIPDDRAGQQRWIDEGKTPGERLAREWQVESKNLRTDPNRPSPQGIAESRMAQVMDLFRERAIDDGYVPTNQVGKPEPGADG